jgi:orotate phosphoribosyltransferase
MTDLAAPQTQPRAARVIDKTDPRWVRLHEIIESQSLKRGDFILSSGRRSKYLFQLRQTTMMPEGATLIGDIIVDYMYRVGLDCVGGLEMGAVPLVCAASVMSFVKASPKSAFFVRKAAKQHGARERIDGYVQSGAEVLIVDDVATSGGSILKAIEGLKEENIDCPISKALVIVDRQEGASENLAKLGIELVSIFKKEDFDI